MLTFNKEEHKYFWNNKQVQSVTQILDGLVDYSHATEIDMKWGQLVHEATEDIDRGIRTLDSFKEPMDARMGAWVAFKKDYGFEFYEHQIEVKLYHTLYGYAGTADRIKPRLTIDIKSGALNDVCGYQLSGYSECDIRLWKEGTMKRMVDYGPIERMGVQLKADGTYKVRMYRAKSDFTKFLEQLGKRRKENGSSSEKD